MSRPESRCTDVVATATSGSNASGVATLTAATGMTTYLTHVVAGYSTATGLGTLTITDGVISLVYPINTVTGTLVIDFTAPVQFKRATNVTATIAAGGGTNTGTVTVAGYQI